MEIVVQTLTLTPLRDLREIKGPLAELLRVGREEAESAEDYIHATLTDEDEIYDAIGQPSLLAIGNRSESPTCLVEQAVNASLDRAFESAEALLLGRLGEVTLAEIMGDVEDRKRVTGLSHELEHHHAS